MLEIKIENKIKAILFDMDGVVTDSMPYHASAWKRSLLDYGLDVDELDIYKREGVPGVQTIKEVFAQFNREKPSDKLINKIYTLKHGYFDSSKVELFNEINDIFKILKQKGLFFALVTGSTRESMERTLPRSIQKYFDYIICGDEVNSGKPDPEPYLTALDKLKISNDEAIVIENAPMGIKSAKAAGLKCFAIATSLPVEYLKDADLIFNDHDEFLSFCKKNIA